MAEGSRWRLSLLPYFGWCGRREIGEFLMGLRMLMALMYLRIRGFRPLVFVMGSSSLFYGEVIKFCGEFD